MTMVIPRLDRRSALEIIERHADRDLADLGHELPLQPDGLTYPPVGGARLDPNAETWGLLRADLLSLAYAHGMPEPMQRRGEFEGRCARLLHERLPMSAHEAAHDEVWSYITCCWLLDVARWRWGHEADVRRFIGDLNRNTFRRLWWRAETFGPGVDLTRLGEDELVAIMERPTIASDQRLAQTMAAEFLDRVGAEAQEHGRMLLMRDASKRILRLTPFVDMAALDDAELRHLVAETYERAAAGIEGRSAAPADAQRSTPAPRADPAVTSVERLVMDSAPSEPDQEPAAGPPDDFEAVAAIALDLVRRTGNVTNLKLRELTNITADEAREVFKHLLDRGTLVRRGTKRGTHYVFAEETPAPATEPVSATAKDAAEPRPTTEKADSSLRRFLRRRR